MGKERELWCDGDKAVAIKQRYESLLMSFVKHHDYKDCDGRKGDTYACNLDGVDVHLLLRPMLYRKDASGTLHSDIAAFFLQIEQDSYRFVIPREWMVVDATRSVYKPKTAMVYAREALFDEVMSFVEDYL